MKKNAFPNDTFISQDEYFAFAMEHKVFGTDAYKLKKKLSKPIPMPRIKLRNKQKLDNTL